MSPFDMLSGEVVAIEKRQLSAAERRQRRDAARSKSRATDRAEWEAYVGRGGAGRGKKFARANLGTASARKGATRGAQRHHRRRQSQIGWAGFAAVALGNAAGLHWNVGGYRDRMMAGASKKAKASMKAHGVRSNKEIRSELEAYADEVDTRAARVQGVIDDTTGRGGGHQSMTRKPTLKPYDYDRRRPINPN